MYYTSPLKHFALGLLLMGVLGGLSRCGALSSPVDTHYPSIKEAALEMKISKPQLEKSEELVIEDVSGQEAYRLSVHSISLDGRTVNSIRLELNGVGSDATRSDTEYEPDLLNPDRWGHGAGQRVFLPEQLCPANRDTPEWGATRVFTLRRMKIEVRVSEIQMNEQYEGIINARVSVHVAPSSSTQSRPADIPYAEPKPCL